MRRERRQNERIPVGGRLRAELIGHVWDVTLLNVSIGGFGVTSATPIPAGGKLEFRFSSADGQWSTTLVARASYILPEPTHHGPDPLYRVGFSFDNAYKVEVRRRILDLIAIVDAVAAG